MNMRLDAIWCILRHNFEKCSSVCTDLVASGSFFRYSYLYTVMITTFFWEKLLGIILCGGEASIPQIPQIEPWLREEFLQRQRVTGKDRRESYVSPKGWWEGQKILTQLKTALLDKRDLQDRLPNLNRPKDLLKTSGRLTVCKLCPKMLQEYQHDMKTKSVVTMTVKKGDKSYTQTFCKMGGGGGSNLFKNNSFTHLQESSVIWPFTRHAQFTKMYKNKNISCFLNLLTGN